MPRGRGRAGGPPGKASSVPLARSAAHLSLGPDIDAQIESLPGISWNETGTPVIKDGDITWELRQVEPAPPEAGTKPTHFVFAQRDTAEPLGLGWLPRQMRITLHSTGDTYIGVADDESPDDWTLHCTFAPAINRVTDGTREWRLNGKRHREGGPALETGDGYKAWFWHGRYHREDGPAKEHPDGSREWLIHGEHHRLDGPSAENADGSFTWHRNGLAHREDGPAVRDEHGSESWWFDGRLHREGGPAIEDSNGVSSWWRHDKRHREDGPAVVQADGTVEWWLDGEQLTLAQWRRRMGLPFREMRSSPASVAAAMNRR